MPDVRGHAMCINHPGLEAVARCPQCAKPVCGTCVVIGPTGKFCSEPCRELHEHFVERAQKLDVRHGRGAGLFSKLKRLTVKLVVFALAILTLATVVTYFDIVDIPILGDFLRKHM